MSALGRPLTIREVAAMLGCSVWTVRQKLLPQGLPFFRLEPSCRLTFFENQVVAWVQKRQGGNR
jgi:hypothetical protein